MAGDSVVGNAIRERLEEVPSALWDKAKFLEYMKKRNPGEVEFHQAVEEVINAISDFLQENPEYTKNKLLERLIEPERAISFRVVITNDKGETEVYRGYRVQMNSALGPYKGGLRFHPSVNYSIIKFLAFEQIFKNALTGLPLGAGKGGANFDPKIHSEREIMLFCQAFMNELYRHIDAVTDVPAGDMGVGTREIGYLFGQYRKIANKYVGVLTGKGIEWGGSHIRKEATGYGLLYFVEAMLNHIGDTVQGKKVIISGAGNVAIYAAEKAMEMGAKVIAMSDTSGYFIDEKGLNEKKLESIKEIKEVKRGQLIDFAKQFGIPFFENGRIWEVPCHIALPCATQNELNEDDAKKLIKNGCIVVAEGANMPSTPQAVKLFLQNRILYGPGKAANAGGVAVSGLEMSQNAYWRYWTRKKVDLMLKQIMLNIHRKCVQYGQDKKDGYVDYYKGANIAGFVRVAKAMMDQGLI